MLKASLLADDSLINDMEQPPIDFAARESNGYQQFGGYQKAVDENQM